MRYLQFRFFFALLFVFLAYSVLYTQVYERKIVEYVRLISEGKSDLVEPKVSDLQRKIPRTAGIIYVEGLIATNEHESVRCFRTIIDSFPKSEWADDALARLFEYNLQSGTFSEAEQSFKKLENTYPSSPYVTTGYLNQQRLNQDNLASRDTQPRAQGEEWAVQIGAFSLKENAVKLQQKLISNGYRSSVYENLLDGKNLLYLVWVGTFDTADEARPLLKELKTKFNINGVLRMRTSWKKW
jgi:hypothetical protein